MRPRILTKGPFLDKPLSLWQCEFQKWLTGVHSLVNSECLRVFEERLVLNAKKQLGELDKNIEADKRLAASKGLLQSGAMINGVKGLCTKVLEYRVDYIFEILYDLPFKYSPRLGATISEISLKYFPVDLGELHTRLDNIIRLANGERARDTVIDNVLKANKTEIIRFKSLLDQFLMNLKTKNKSWIRRLWEDPVWSKVIAGVILAIGGSIIGYIIRDKLAKMMIALKHVILWRITM
jgi:hypothetical protein